MDDRQGKASSRMPQRDPQALDVRAVAAHLAQHGLQIDLSHGAHRLSGGLSNLNYLIHVDGRKAVLRRPPMGELPVGAHDMAREHTILSRLSRVWSPAPDSFFLCSDPSVIGAPFQLLECRTGLVLQGDKLPAALDTLESRRELSRELVATLAGLHSVDAAGIGLGDFGRPDGFFERNVRGWLKRCAALEPDAAIASTVERIGDWLLSNQPGTLEPTLLHSDFKLDNCMLDETLKVSTVLDWDMGTRGDPLMDLATLTSYWTEPGDPDCMQRLGQMPTAHPGFFTRMQAVEAYAALTGRDVSGFGAWRILSLLKLGVIFMQLHRNWVRGVAGDSRYAGFADLGGEIVDFAAGSMARPI